MMLRKSVTDMIDLLLEFISDYASPIAQLVERAAVSPRSLVQTQLGEQPLWVVTQKRY